MEISNFSTGQSAELNIQYYYEFSFAYKTIYELKDDTVSIMKLDLPIIDIKNKNDLIKFFQLIKLKLIKGPFFNKDVPSHVLAIIDPTNKELLADLLGYMEILFERYNWSSFSNLQGRSNDWLYTGNNDHPGFLFSFFEKHLSFINADKKDVSLKQLNPEIIEVTTNEGLQKLMTTISSLSKISDFAIYK